MKKQTVITDYSHEADNDMDNVAQTAFNALEKTPALLLNRMYSPI
ncbi:MAG: hypothetical protein WBP45_08595 [Daejeonella sp.]